MADEVKTGDESLTEDGDLFSLDDLDKMLEDTDPEFAQSLDEMKNDKDLQSAEVQDIEIDEGESSEPGQPSKMKLALKKVLRPIKKKVITPARKIVNAAIGRLVWTKAWVKRTTKEAKTFVINDLPDRIKYFRSHFKKTAHDRWLWFKALSGMQKTLVALVVPFISLVSALVIMVTKGVSLPMLEPPLIGNLEEYADSVVKYNVATDMVNYYRAFRQNEFTVQLDRIVVNIRPSQSSSSLPMAAIRLYLAGSTQQTAIEIKDREKELKDVISRVVEDMSYDDLNSTRGKEQLKERVINAVNQRLNVGIVMTVYMETFVIKP